MLSPRFPLNIKLGGLNIKTVINNEMYRQTGKLGSADYPNQAIILAIEDVQPQTVEQTYCHEKVHWILHMMNRDDLRSDEAFVDVFAHFLYQTEQSAKYLPDPAIVTMP